MTSQRTVQTRGAPIKATLSAPEPMIKRKDLVCPLSYIDGGSRYK